MHELNVLIVDDDPMVAEINARFTAALPGFRVMGKANDGAEALFMLDNMRIDLIVLDVYLPKVEGTEVLTKIRQTGKKVDILMVTAANDTFTISTAIRNGVIGYIIKPFKFERYKAILENYRDMKLKLKHKGSISQGELDKLLVVKQQKDAPLPKNLHKATLATVLNFLHDTTQAVSAEEVASGTGLSRATVRRYLEYLTEINHIEMFLEYLSVGRPTNRYRLKK